MSSPGTLYYAHNLDPRVAVAVARHPRAPLRFVRAEPGVVTATPSAREARLPLERFPRIRHWHARLEALDAWREPFARLDRVLRARPSGRSRRPRTVRSSA